MDKFFSVFGKVALAVIVLGGVAYAAYTYGHVGYQPHQTNPQPTQEIMMQPTGTSTPLVASITTTPSTTPATTVTAGLNHAGGSMFPGYTITIASGWTPNHEQQLTGSASDTLTVTKNGYAIKIYQAAFGGGICLYPGDPDQMGPNARYTSFVAFSGASGEQYRRGTTNTTPPMTSVCMNTSGTYGSITTFGHIDYTIPASPDATTLAQMDSMIATLKTQ